MNSFAVYRLFSSIDTGEQRSDDPTMSYINDNVVRFVVDHNSRHNSADSLQLNLEQRLSYPRNHGY